MTSFYGNFQWKVLKYFVDLLQQDAYLKSMTDGRVYARHLSTVENPKFPAVTIARGGLGADPGIQQINYMDLQIDVWSKKNIIELWRIYADHSMTTNKPIGVRALLSQQTFDFPEVQVDLCVETNVTDDMYEPWSKTYRLSAEYHVCFVAKNVI